MKKGLILGISVLVLSLLPTSVFASTYDGTAVSSESDGETYKVTAASGDTLTLIDVGSGSGKIALTFSSDVNGSILIEESSSKPSGASSEAPGSVNVYFNVTLNGLTNADISSAKWTFSVAKDWLKSKGVASTNVFLHHYDSNWERLTTSEVSSSSTSHTFEADVNDFSPFAVTAVEGLSNTGSPYMLGALLAGSSLAIVGGTFALSRRKASSE